MGEDLSERTGMSWHVWLTTEVDGHDIPIHDDFLNYTHNCNQMIRDAGFNEWPYQVDGWIASKLRKRLISAISLMEEQPDRFKAMNPENGWGNYDTLLVVLREVRDICEKFPSATVRMSA